MLASCYFLCDVVESSATPTKLLSRKGGGGGARGAGVERGGVWRSGGGDLLWWLFVFSFLILGIMEFLEGYSFSSQVAQTLKDCRLGVSLPFRPLLSWAWGLPIILPFFCPKALGLPSFVTIRPTLLWDAMASPLPSWARLFSSLSPFIVVPISGALLSPNLSSSSISARILKSVRSISLQLSFCSSSGFNDCYTFSPLSRSKGLETP